MPARMPFARPILAHRRLLVSAAAVGALCGLTSCSPAQEAAWLRWNASDPQAATEWAANECGALCTDDTNRNGIVEPDANGVPDPEVEHDEDFSEPEADYSGGGTVWDAIASCESGGDWSIDTGNGYSGGLQWLDSTWDTYRSSDAPSYAADASREQQIAAAERLLAAAGDYGAWPTCAANLGLPT